MSRARRSAGAARWPKRLVAGLAVAAAMLLVGEGVARVAGPLVPTWQARDTGAVILVGHPTRLWYMAEGERENAGTTATIGKNGLRGKPVVVPRPAGRERVILVGDSSFFGHGVGEAETPTERLRVHMLEAGIDADVVNAAVPGYSTEQSILLMEELGWATEPTLLVIANVWSDYNFDHFRDADLLRTQRVFGDNPLAGSALFQMTAGVVDRLRGGRGARLVTWTKASTLPPTGTRRVPVGDFAANLDKLVRAAKAHGAGAVIVQPTNRQMASGDASDTERRAPYFAAQDEVAAWHGIPVARTLPAFTAAAAAQGIDAVFIDDLHPTAAGDDLVATTLLQTMTGAGWPTTRLQGKDEPFDASALTDPFAAQTPPEVGDGSPQVNLFPREGAPRRGDGKTVDPGWHLAGRVEGPPGEAHVEVRSLGGAAISTMKVQVPGAFSAEVGPNNSVVVVVAQGPKGTVQSEAAADRGEVVVRLPN